MTNRKKSRREALGSIGPGAFAYLHDESVPDLTSALRTTQIDPVAFAAALSEPLGDYRVIASYMAERAQPAAVKQWLLDAAADVDGALADGRLRWPPGLAESALFHAVYRADPRRDGRRMVPPWMAVRSGQPWSIVWLSLLEGDKGILTLILQRAAASIGRQTVRPGRPSSKERDTLLKFVLDELRRGRVRGEKAMDVALEVLSACGVECPGAESISRARRRARTI